MTCHERTQFRIYNSIHMYLHLLCGVWSVQAIIFLSRQLTIRKPVGNVWHALTVRSLFYWYWAFIEHWFRCLCCIHLLKPNPNRCSGLSSISKGDMFPLSPLLVLIKFSHEWRLTIKKSSLTSIDWKSMKYASCRYFYNYKYEYTIMLKDTQFINWTSCSQFSIQWGN